MNEELIAELVALRESIVHGLRSQGWSRIEAENEADARIERMRAKAMPDELLKEQPET